MIKQYNVTVNGTTYEVTVESAAGGRMASAPVSRAAAAPVARAAAPAPAAAPAQEARLPAASRQDFFQTMDAKTFRQGGAKPAPQPAAPARPAWNTELRAPARVADSGQTSFYQTKRSESAA